VCGQAGLQGSVDGTVDVALLTHVVDMALAPDGTTLYFTDAAADGIATAIRRVTITTGRHSRLSPHIPMLLLYTAMPVFPMRLPAIAVFA
jgi:hypothetical protein